MIYDVVIAGAGPVGLFVASELGLRGLSVLVFEKMEDPQSPLKTGWMGMRGLNWFQICLRAGKRQPKPRSTAPQA